MPREEKRIRLTEVDEDAQNRPPTFRLESEKAVPWEEPVRLKVPVSKNILEQRITIPPREDGEMRTHQPGIEALIETNQINLNPVEDAWGLHSVKHKQFPWGWFVLVGLVLGGAVIWSMTRVTEAAGKTKKIHASTVSALLDDEREEMEAAQLIERIHATTKEFFDATSIKGMARHVRQQERVLPLIEAYYADHPFPTHRLDSFKTLQALTLDKQATFWMASVILDNREERNLLIEILPTGEARIDWETMVCYQPMPWDEFAITKPKGVSFDFRVYVEQDQFFSHEFADSDRWCCFKLTAIDSEETLFGYTKTGSELSGKLIEQLQLNGGGKASMILRMIIPEGLQSHKGIIIEKLMSPRWLYITPPAAEL